MTESRPLDILVFSSIGNDGASSFLDHIAMLGQYSKHRCFYHNFVYQFDPEMDFSGFDVIVFTHNFWLPAVNEAQRKAIAAADALKVLFLQDEFQYVRRFNDVMAEMGIDLMFSCTHPRDFETFYPKSLIPTLREVHPTLTGYVPDHLTKPGVRARGARTWDIGYRGRPPIYYMGLLGQHKTRIAHEFTALAVQNGFSHNISYHEEDRIYGEAWFNFLRSTRVQLGSPSGTSIVDFDGSLIEAEAAYRAGHPHATFQQVHDAILSEHEGRVVIDTLSPRHFEYAATGATMAMVTGEYGGYLRPDEHYIPVAPDYSNLKEVALRIRDHKRCEEVADRAHAHLIASGDFSARRFVEEFDAIIGRHATRDESRVRQSLEAFAEKMEAQLGQVLVFDRNGYRHVPRGEGRKIRMRALQSKAMGFTPVLGGMLRKSGGNHLLKWAKGRAALQLARSIPTFRPLLTEWLLNTEARYAQENRLEFVLKAILMLGLVKAAQSGAAPYGHGFHARIVREGGRLALTGVPADPGVAAAGPDGAADFGWSPELSSVLARGEIDDIAIDLSGPWPMKVFGNSTFFPWQLKDRVIYMRSDADEYFHLVGLSRLAQAAPAAVSNALREAVTAANADQVEVLRHVFGCVIPDPAGS